MKSSMLKFISVLALSLVFAGCSTTGDKAAEGDGAPVSEAGQGEEWEGGAQLAGATEGAAWSGSALDNPDSPLYSKVIYFDFDSSEIRADFVDVVAAHGDYLAADPSVTVTIEGHTDERGSREYNIALGERRANAVKRLLMVQGAAESQIVTISYGEERPADPGLNEAAWDQNRRAELIY